MARYVKYLLAAVLFFAVINLIFIFVLPHHTESLKQELKSSVSSPKPVIAKVVTTVASGGDDCSLYDFGLVETWRGSKIPLCRDGWKNDVFSCNMLIVESFPAPTRPHTFCLGHKVVLDLNKLTKAWCPVHRPGYRCDVSETYYRYSEGSFSFSCEPSKPKKEMMELVSRDNMRDVVGGMVFNEVTDDVVEEEDGFTFLIVRETMESNNLYHAMSDFFNAYVATLMYDIDPSEVQVVLMDEHPKSKIDEWWDLVVSKKRKKRHISDLISKGSMKKKVNPFND